MAIDLTNIVRQSELYMTLYKIFTKNSAGIQTRVMLGYVNQGGLSQLSHVENTFSTQETDHLR